MMLPRISRNICRRLLVLAFAFLSLPNFLAPAGGASPSRNLAPTMRAGVGGSSQARRAAVEPADFESAEANPIDEARVFALQHYFDFLNREPDAAGLDFWTNEIAACPTPECVERKRINVSAAFFLSGEFQETGYFAIRVHKAAYGNQPGNPRYLAFLRDQAKLGEGVIVGEPDAQARLDENKRRFVAEFVGRAEFVARYPESTSGGAYVDALYANAGVVPTQADRDAAFIAFGNGGAQGRARTLQVVAERELVSRRLYNTAFVLMQYFGYLRRNPDDAPQPGLNFDGYNFWLAKLDSFGGDYVAADMVKAFILSGEYRARFTGTKITLFGNRHDPLLFRAEQATGATVEYFGEKDGDGLAARLTAARVRDAQGAASTYFFDAAGRPTLMEAANGVIFHLNWQSDTSVLLTATSPDGSVQVPVPLTLSSTLSNESPETSIAAIPSSSQTGNIRLLSEAEIRPDFLQKASTEYKTGDGSMLEVKRREDEAKRSAASCFNLQNSTFMHPASSFDFPLRPSSLAEASDDSTAEVRVTRCGGAETVDDAAVRIRVGGLPVADAIPAALSAFGSGAYRASVPTADVNAGSRTGIKFESAKLVSASACDASQALRAPSGQSLCASIANALATHSGGVAPPAAAVAAIAAACPAFTAGLGQICAGDDDARAVATVVNRADAAHALSLEPEATLDGLTLAGETRTGAAALAQPFAIDFPCHPAASIEVSPPATFIDIGENIRFNAVVRNGSGAVVNVPFGRLQWRIENAQGGATTAATVDAVGNVAGVGAGSVVLVVTETRSGKTAFVPLTVSPPVARVEIAASASVLDRGQRTRLAATARDAAGNALAIAPARFQWTTANASVATIEGAGNEVEVRGVGVGATQIAVVETRSGKSATLNVAVESPIKSVEVSSPSGNRVEVSKSLALAATARDAAGNVVALAPDKFEWSSSNAGVATVDELGRVAAVAAGIVQVVVKETESGTSASMQINVFALIDRVVIMPAGDWVEVGQTRVFAVAALDAQGVVVPVASQSFVWSTSNQAIATVDANGTLTGITQGTTTLVVTETLSGKTATATVAVYPPIDRVEITPAAASVDAAHSVQLTATARDAQGVALAIPSNTFAWRSANLDIATLNPANGATTTATGIAAGATQITVTETRTGKSASVELTVNPIIDHIVISPQNPSVQVCGALQLTATAIDEQGSIVPSATFQWQTAHRGIVNVGSGGLATGVTTGTAQITATETASGKSASIAVNSLGSTSRVLEFDGSPKTVDYYLFWEPDIDLGHFFWEFWAAPVGLDAGATYLLSDGYGGAHALLFGFGFYGSSEPGRYQLFGNVYDGTRVIFIGSDEGPAPGEWAHFSVGWDGQLVVTYFNGVPVGATPFAGPRRTPGFYGGGGRALVGGSDHNNLVGKIAQLRGYEGSNPREGAGRSVLASFAPQTLLRDGGNVASNFFCEGNPVADLSEGHQGNLHTGRLRGTLHPYGILGECPDCPLPQYVVDPTAPKFLDEANAAPSPAPQPSPSPAPANALVFDSFSRANSTYALGAKGGLGSTESGTAGARAWQTNRAATDPQPFGILNGRAVLLADDASLAWIQTGSTNGNLDVRVDRRPGERGTGISTALSFRVVDAANFFFAYTDGSGVHSSNAQKLNVGYYSGGARTDLATDVNLPAQWTRLRVVTHGGGQIAVYADATLIYSTVNGLLSSATGAGVYNNARGLGLANRWDNFTVYAAQ